jgi:Fe-S cluster assembly protein SufB
MNSVADTPELDQDTLAAVDIDRSIGDFSYPEAHKFDAGVGLNEATVKYISDVKDDPQWVRDFRLKALKTFEEKAMPTNQWTGAKAFLG